MLPSTALPELLQGEETKVWGAPSYRGQTAAIREAAPLAQAYGISLSANKLPA